VIAWRLPAASSTPRVTVWRTLRRIGAVPLTPGAAILPFSDDHQERLDWLAQDVDDAGGQAWVLPVTQLAAEEEARITAQSMADRDEEFARLLMEAREVAESAGRGEDHGRRIASLRRQLEAVCRRDHFNAPLRQDAVELIGAPGGPLPPASQLRRTRTRR
jgi:hypothetical protein